MQSILRFGQTLNGSGYKLIKKLQPGETPDGVETRDIQPMRDEIDFRNLTHPDFTFTPVTPSQEGSVTLKLQEAHPDDPYKKGLSGLIVQDLEQKGWNVEIE